MTIDATKTTGTEVGNYFVSNYPPFSQWKPEFVDDALAALREPPRVNDPLGLYIHIPFCRKRCKFCYFKVYTDKNASEIEVYLDALIKENELYSRDRKSTRLNSSHSQTSYAVFCLKKKTPKQTTKLPPKWRRARQSMEPADDGPTGPPRAP